MSDVPLGLRAQSAAKKRGRDAGGQSGGAKRVRVSNKLAEVSTTLSADADPRLVKFAKLFSDSKKRSEKKGKKSAKKGSKGPVSVPIAKKKVGLQPRMLGTIGAAAVGSGKSKRDPRFDPLCGTLPPQSAPELIASRFPFIAQAEEQEEREITAKLRRHRLALQDGEDAEKAAKDDSDESSSHETAERTVLTDAELDDLNRRRQSLRSRLFSRADAEKKRLALRKIRDEEAAAVAKGKTPYFHSKAELRRITKETVDHDAKREARKGRRDGNVARRQLREMKSARERKER